MCCVTYIYIYVYVLANFKTYTCTIYIYTGRKKEDFEDAKSESVTRFLDLEHHVNEHGRHSKT